MLNVSLYVTAFALVGYLFHIVHGGDIWVRMASGRFVLEELAIPRNDPFSYTVPGREWVDNEWLMGIVLYLLYRIDYELIAILFGLLVILPVLIVHIHVLKKGAAPLPAFGLAALAVVAPWQTYLPRPALLNPVFFAILLVLIDSYRSSGAQRQNRYRTKLPILAIVPLTWAWANLQAGFLAGIAILVVWTLVSLSERRDQMLSLLVTAAAVLVGFLNAYGWELHRYIVGTIVGSGAHNEYVHEWLSPDFHNPVNVPMIMAIAVALYFGLRESDRFRQLILVGTLIASLVALRYQPFFAVALLFTAAPLAKGGIPSPVALRRMRFVMVPFLAFGLAAFLGTFGARPTEKEPTGGVDFLRDNCPSERVLAHVDMSSYMVFRRLPVAVDGRLNQVYPDQFLRDYYRFEKAIGDWDEFPAKYDFSVLMLPKDWSTVRELQERGWTKVFEGDVEAILVHERQCSEAS